MIALLGEMADDAGGAREDRNAFDGGFGKIEIEKYGADRGRDVEDERLAPDRHRRALLVHYLRADVPHPENRRQHLDVESAVRLSARERELLGLDDEAND